MMGSRRPHADAALLQDNKKNKEYEQEIYHHRTARQCPYADIVPSVGTKGRNGKAGGQHRNQ